jgi:hypothetical protein
LHCSILLDFTYFHFSFTVSRANLCQNLEIYGFFAFKLFFTSMAHYMFRPIWSSSDASRIAVENVYTSPVRTSICCMFVMQMHTTRKRWLFNHCGPWPLFSFITYSQSVGLLGRVINSSQGLYLNTGQHKHRIKHTYTPNIHALSRIRTHNHSVRANEDSSCLKPLGYRDRLASERAKTVRALDRSATVTGHPAYTTYNDSCA